MAGRWCRYGRLCDLAKPDDSRHGLHRRYKECYTIVRYCCCNNHCRYNIQPYCACMYGDDFSYSGIVADREKAPTGS